MSVEEKEAADLEAAIALKAELEGTLYKDLKTKLEELKLDSVWKNGLNKGELIKLALQKWEELKSLEGKTEEEIAIDAAKVEEKIEEETTTTIEDKTVIEEISVIETPIADAIEEEAPIIEETSVIQATDVADVIDENVKKTEEDEEEATEEQKSFDQKGADEEVEVLGPEFSTELEETEYEFSEEELRENLANIDACLIQPSPTHRLILLAKKEKIEKKLYDIIGYPVEEVEE